MTNLLNIFKWFSYVSKFVNFVLCSADMELLSNFGFFLFQKTFWSQFVACSLGLLYNKMAFQLTFVGAASAILQLFDNAIFHCAKLYHFIDGLLVIILEVTTHRTQNVGQVIFHQENFLSKNARFKHFLFSRMRMFWFLFVS